MEKLLEKIEETKAVLTLIGAEDELSRILRALLEVAEGKRKAIAELNSCIQENTQLRRTIAQLEEALKKKTQQETDGARTMKKLAAQRDFFEEKYQELREQVEGGAADAEKSL